MTVQATGPKGAALAAAAVLLLLVATAPTAVAAPQAVPAGVPAQCAGINPYRVTADVRAKCKIIPGPLRSVTRRSDGGREFHYTVAGDTIVLKQAPAGFDAAAASKSEREAYGVPPEPSADEATAHARWEQMIHDYHLVAPPAELYAVPESSTGSQPKHAPAGDSSATRLTGTLGELDPGAVASSSGSASSVNWSGYVDLGSTGSYNQTGIIYYEPPTLENCPGAATSLWTGIAGWETTPLDQAGSDLGGDYGTAPNQAWFEIWPDEAELPMPLEATPGFLFEASITHESGNRVTGLLYNLHSGEALPVEGISKETYSGATAEYIAERPTVATKHVPLANFGQWDVQEAWANGNHANGPWAFSNDAVTMSEGKVRTAEPSALSSPEGGATEFYVNWRAYDGEGSTCHPYGLPSATTEGVRNVQEASATLTGSVNPDGNDTHYYFEYGTTRYYGSFAPGRPGEDVGSGSSPVPVSAQLAGLHRGVTYHYRLIAENAFGTSYGADRSFTTQAPTPAAVATSGGNEYIYYRGEEGAIWQADGSGDVKRLGGSAAGDPVAVALSSGEQDVYFRGADGHLWRWSLNPSTAAWALSQVGGVIVGEPTVAPAYPYSVFFRQGEGCQRCLYQAYLSGGTWQTRALGGDMEGKPIAVATPAGVEEVFWSHTGSGVLEEWSSANPMSASPEWHYSEVGGTATAERPAAVAYSSGNVGVFFQAKEGCILCDDEMLWNGSGWATKWGVGQLAGGPVAATESESEQRVFWRGSDGAIWDNHGPIAEPWGVERIGEAEASGNPGEVYRPSASVPTSIYFIAQGGGLDDLYLWSGSWNVSQLCAWPCPASGPQEPAVTRVSPNNDVSGTGGESITIEGEYFSGVTAVKFGTTNAASYTVNSSTKITAVAPPGTGTVDVTVTNGNGISPTTPNDLFTYLPYTTGRVPSAVALPDSSEYVYFRGENGAIWQADSFGGVQELGGSAAGDPVAVALSSGERDVYFRGTNGAIWRWYFAPSSQTWSLTEVGGVAVGEPAVAPQDPYSVFFRQGEGCQRCIYQGYLSGGSWQTRALGGDDEGTPDAVATPAGVEEVFWSHTGSGVLEEWSSANPMSASPEWHYSEVGGTATAERPAAVAYSSGNVGVFFQAKEGCILCDDEMLWNGSGWATKWGVGQLAGGPVAATESESEQRVFWRGSDGAIWDNHGPIAEPWGVERPGGDPGGDPTEVYVPGGSVTSSIYYFDQTGGLSDMSLAGGAWSQRQLCAWPCGAHGGQQPVVTGLAPDAGTTTGGTVVKIAARTSAKCPPCISAPPAPRASPSTARTRSPRSLRRAAAAWSTSWSRRAAVPAPRSRPTSTPM